VGPAIASAGIGAGTAIWLCLHRMQHESFWDAQLLYLLMTLTVIGLVIRAGTPVLGGRFMTHIGKISYGIYLLHLFVISAVRKLPGGDSPAVCLLAGTIGAVLIASLVYKFFEQPIIAWYKRKLSPLNAPASEPAGEAADAMPAILPQCRIS
jgi:peptidoglycan/LPS O-acetylase OafA/YrhL